MLLRESTPEERMKSDHDAWELHSVAFDIEKWFVLNGATPGEDYTFLDLYKLAAEFSKAKAIEWLADATDDINHTLEDITKTP